MVTVAVPSDGTCTDCGVRLDPDQPDYHRLCWSCWRRDHGGSGDDYEDFGYDVDDYDVFNWIKVS